MILRYLVLFGGIVLMINGCNSLISQQFGTHSLHTMQLEQVVNSGVGDADFLEIPDARVGEALVSSPREGWLDANYVFRPLLTNAQTDAWRNGQVVTAQVIAWYNVDTTNCANRAWCQPPTLATVAGLVAEPPANKHPTADWEAERIALAPEITYLKLGDKPMVWYWNLLMFLGGLLLAALPEARRHRQQQLDASTS
ncbi:MAG: hypothetical protein AAF597_09765 [Bacteroidota bacterium]